MFKRTAEFARNDNLAPLGTTLHDESEDTITGSSNGQTSEQLVSETFTLSDGAQSSVTDLLSVQLQIKPNISKFVYEQANASFQEY